MACRNETCNENPLNKMNAIIVSIDGDLVCDKDCEKQYEAQKAKFFNETVHCPEKTQAYLLGN